MHSWLTYYFLDKDGAREYLCWFLYLGSIGCFWISLVISILLFLLLCFTFLILENIEGKSLILLEYFIHQVLMSLSCLQKVNDLL